MSTKAIESLSEDTVRRIAEERDEPEWLLGPRLNALSALETADLPDVIQTPGRRWTDLGARLRGARRPAEPVGHDRAVGRR